MHTYAAPHGTRFHHDGDALRSPNSRVIIVAKDATAGLEIPCGDLLALVAELVRSERISAIEDATHLELLGLPEKR